MTRRSSADMYVCWSLFTEIELMWYVCALAKTRRGDASTIRSIGRKTGTRRLVRACGASRSSPLSCFRLYPSGRRSRSDTFHSFTVLSARGTRKGHVNCQLSDTAVTFRHLPQLHRLVCEGDTQGSRQLSTIRHDGHVLTPSTASPSCLRGGHARVTSTVNCQTRRSRSDTFHSFTVLSARGTRKGHVNCQLSDTTVAFRHLPQLHRLVCEGDTQGSRQLSTIRHGGRVQTPSTASPSCLRGGHARVTSTVNYQTRRSRSDTFHSFTVLSARGTRKGHVNCQLSDTAVAFRHLPQLHRLVCEGDTQGPRQLSTVRHDGRVQTPSTASPSCLRGGHARATSTVNCQTRRSRSDTFHSFTVLSARGTRKGHVNCQLSDTTVASRHLPQLHRLVCEGDTQGSRQLSTVRHDGRVQTPSTASPSCLRGGHARVTSTVNCQTRRSRSDTFHSFTVLSARGTRKGHVNCQLSDTAVTFRHLQSCLRGRKGGGGGNVTSTCQLRPTATGTRPRNS